MAQPAAPLRGMIAMWPSVIDQVLPADLRERLSKSVVIEPGDVVTDLTSAAARAALLQTDVLITGWGCPQINEQVLASAPRLTAVIHAAGSVKSFLCEQVWQQGIQVSSAAEVGAEPVAAYTLAAVTFAGKRALPAARRYAQGHFPSHRERVDGNDGRVVGVIGASRIGRRVICGLVAAGYQVLVSDPYLDALDAVTLGAELTEVDELCRRCSIITLHAPLLPATRHLIDARRLAMMTPGTTLINTARGALVDTTALAKACAAGHIDAILDVTEPEPLPADHALFALPNVLVTPHLAGAQGSEVRRFGEFAVAEVERHASGEPLRGTVRAEDLPILA